MASRRLSDINYYQNSMATEEVANPLKMRLFLGGLFAVFTAIVIFLPLYMYILVVLWLLTDYFILMGGTLNWMNHKIDSDYKGTGFFRRILASDARMVLVTTSISIMILIVNYFSSNTGLSFQWSDKPFSHSLHMVYAFLSYADISFNDTSRAYVLQVMVRGLLVANLIHVIHHLLINQRLAGVQFTKYPPILNFINNLVIWARK